MIQLLLIVLFVHLVSAVAKSVWAFLLIAHDSKALKIKKDYTYSPKVSVLLPCFNEGKVVYDTMESICKSDYADFEVIAIDDCSKDDSVAWMRKAAAEFPNIRVLVNETNRGKNKSQMRGFRESTGDVIICIDSDCIFAPDTMRELVACLADPTMGAVGGRVAIKNVNESIVTRFQAFMYFIGFQLYKIPENWSRTIVCISGCLFATRRSIIAELEPILENRHWFGIPVAEGEDRFMTHMVLLKGLGTYINLDAKCWTDVPNAVTKYFKQQLRWRRSAFRDIFMTIRLLPLHVKKLHWNVTYSIMMPAFSLLYGAIGVFFAPKFDPLFWASPLPWAVYIFSCLLFCIIIKRISPDQAVTNPLLMIGFGAWWLVSHFFITVLALLTMDAPDWGTRTKVNTKILEESWQTGEIA